MNNRYVIAIALVLLLCFAPQPAQAQEVDPAVIVDSTQPISADIRDAVNAWLAVSPPSTAVYYAVTYTQTVGLVDTFVCLVGLSIQTPDQEWSLTYDDGHSDVIWLGTVKVLEDGTVHLLTRTQAELSQRNVNEVASLDFMPPLAPMRAGGGSYVRFPFEPAKAVKWSGGLHGAGYSLTGQWRAIDLLSGTDMGSGAANDQAYASAPGDVDFVCDDDTTVAITTSGSMDSFLYAHLLNNANLEIGHTFSSGGVIGSLKHGSFADSCGTAVQTAQHWHLHWGFELSSSAAFQAEGCLLTLTAGVGVGGAATAIGEKWTCGNTIIRPSNYLTHYGNIPINDDGTAGDNPNDLGAGSGPSFWDYLLIGFKGIFDTLFTNNLPEHQSVAAFIQPILSGVKIVFRIASVLLKGNFNLAPAAVMIVLTITFKTAVAFLFMVGAIIRIVKSIPFA